MQPIKISAIRELCEKDKITYLDIVDYEQKSGVLIPQLLDVIEHPEIKKLAMLLNLAEE